MKNVSTNEELDCELLQAGLYAVKQLVEQLQLLLRALLPCL
jgi:hypothetical protein